MPLRVDTIVSTRRDSCLKVQRRSSQRAETLIEKKAHDSISVSLAHGNYIVVVNQEGKRIVKKIAL